jgi:hypothetical protein
MSILLTPGSKALVIQTYPLAANNGFDVYLNQNKIGTIKDDITTATFFVNDNNGTVNGGTPYYVSVADSTMPSAFTNQYFEYFDPHYLKCSGVNVIELKPTNVKNVRNSGIISVKVYDISNVDKGNGYNKKLLNPIYISDFSFGGVSGESYTFLFSLDSDPSGLVGNSNNLTFPGAIPIDVGTFSITTSDYIGNSLSTVNLNYYNLEKDIINTKIIIENYWKPVYDFYTTFRDFFKGATSFITSNSAKLINTATTVELNSARWINPISVFYPTILPNSMDSTEIAHTLSAWAWNKFPVANGDIPNYLQGQELIVYTHTWIIGTVIAERRVLSDFTTCNSSSNTVKVNCSTVWNGTATCDNTNFTCKDITATCDTTLSPNCAYGVPYTQTPLPNDSTVVFDIATSRDGAKYIKRVIPNLNNASKPTLKTTSGYGYITAHLDLNFVDRNEAPNIIAIVFKVIECNWYLDRYIVAF